VDATIVRAHQHAAGARKGGTSGYLGSGAERDQALGHSRGGLTTKVHLACDGRGRPLGMLVTAGQRHESTQLEPLLDAIRVPRPGPGRPRKRPAHLIADRATATRPAAGCCASGGSPTPSPSGPTSRPSGPGAALAVAARRHWIRCATSAVTWSSGRSPGSSSTGPSRPATTSWPSATTAGWSWPPSCSGSPHEPPDRP
jgi:hypothetical protein